MNRLKAYLCILVAAMALLGWGCASARRDEPIVGAWHPTSPVAKEGEVLFMQKCHMCHPGEMEGLGPALNNKPLPKFEIRLQVRQGFGTMPAFSHEDISAKELEALAVYLKEIRN